MHAKVPATIASSVAPSVVTAAVWGALLTAAGAMERILEDGIRFLFLWGESVGPGHRGAQRHFIELAQQGCCLEVAMQKLQEEAKENNARIDQQFEQINAQLLILTSR